MSVLLTSSNVSASGSPSPEENFVEALSSLRDSTEKGESSSKAQREAVAMSLESVKRKSDSTLFLEALDISSRSKEEKKSLQHLNLIDYRENQALKQQADKCAAVFNGLQQATTVLKASMFLTCPGKQSIDVAQSFLQGDNPIDTANATILGSGSSGIVNKVSVLGTHSAAKSIKDDRPSQKEKSLKEALILQKCAHPHVIGLNLVDEESGTLYLELAEKGTLSHFSKQPECNAETVENILKQAALGLLHVHNQGYIHGDIKLDNILIDDLNKAKIADFGSATAFQDFQSTELKGTPLYFSPEVIKSAVDTTSLTKIDTWAFGMLIWELLKNTDYTTPFVFPDLNGGVIKPKTFENIHLFVYSVGKHFKGFSLEVLEKTTDQTKKDKLDPTGKLFKLMTSCLAYNPKERPTMEQIIKDLS